MADVQQKGADEIFCSSCGAVIKITAENCANLLCPKCKAMIHEQVQQKEETNIGDINKQRIALIIASGLGISAIFMPWVNIPFLGSINGTQIPDNRCWLPSIIFTIPLIIAFLGDRTKPLIGNIKYAAFVPGLISAIGGIMVIKEINKSFSGPVAIQALNTSLIGFGLYLVIIAGFSVCLLSIIGGKK
ncbi:MAG: hypothetical protein LBC87_05615 [Fibromonadaceae bacterium]|jgi:predicted RNA-binding Zn-ribbon protein involved in translation (DUF1610 family)|nr:hypothetical protein [Fibromonadaceae bacterium]